MRICVYCAVYNKLIEGRSATNVVYCLIHHHNNTQSANDKNLDKIYDFISCNVTQYSIHERDNLFGAYVTYYRLYKEL